MNFNSTEFRKTVIASLTWTLLILVSGCKNSTNLPYSSLARSHHLQLDGDGYILAFEKIKKEEAGIPSRRKPHQDIVKFPSNSLNESDDLNKYKSFFEKKIINESRPLILSHIARYTSGDRGPDFTYNPYSDYPRIKPTIGESDGWHFLKKFQEDLQNRLEDNDYSHVLVMCMGWNNDQHDSIYRYKKIVKNISIANNDSAFKPLIIGITWPSVWESRNNYWIGRKMGHIVSYFSKPDDADELGVVYLNWLLHKAIPDAQGANAIPVVAIGHSFGARAMSRAVYSRDYLIDPNQTREPVDLLIGLQGAFSISRYSGSRPRGKAYADVALNNTLVVYTSSDNDKANNLARWGTRAKNMGASYGIEIAKEKPELFDEATFNKFSLSLDALPEYGKPLVINASSIVVGVDDENPEFSPHNDILDIEMGHLLKICIDSIK